MKEICLFLLISDVLTVNVFWLKNVLVNRFNKNCIRLSEKFLSFHKDDNR